MKKLILTIVLLSAGAFAQSTNMCAATKDGLWSDTGMWSNLTGTACAGNNMCGATADNVSFYNGGFDVNIDCSLGSVGVAASIRFAVVGEREEYHFRPMFRPSLQWTA